MSKTCIRCEKSLPLSSFYCISGRYQKRCRSCEYEHYRFARMAHKYGISESEYWEFYNGQNGCCAICGIHESKIPKRLHVDHCHDTGKVRGLLCAKCNTSIGQFEREPERLLVAYEYIVGDSN